MTVAIMIFMGIYQALKQETNWNARQHMMEENGWVHPVLLELKTFTDEVDVMGKRKNNQKYNLGFFT